MEERSAGPSPLSVRRRRGLMQTRSVKAAPRKAKASPAPSLVKGQIWKVKDTYVQVVDAGKTLIHYTMSPKPSAARIARAYGHPRNGVGLFKSNQADLMEHYLRLKPRWHRLRRSAQLAE